jgi:4-hydroxybenzoate polyprenyltransferase
MPSSALTTLHGLMRLSRPRQWVKNGFVFAPLLFSGYFVELQHIKEALVAFVLFCVASSAIYIVNDIRDVEHDRKHPKKSKTRPLAAEIITKQQAISLLLIYYLILIAGYFFAPLVIYVILVYVALNFAYTFALKHQPVIDIFVIAIGFVLRVIAGTVALSLPPSPWMFVTTLCLALYLASVKRRQELALSGSEGRKVLRHYNVALVDRYAEIAATGALIFYSLFVITVRPELVVTIPIVLYGLFRYWYVVESLEGGESPTDAFFADWQLSVTLLLWIVCTIWAIWPNQV